jgi:two-component system, NtrC family, response regulator GlrR
MTRPTGGGATKARAIRRFRVTVTGGPARGASWPARDREAKERCSIGSHPSNDLVLDDPTVSRFHCELAIAGGKVRVRDLGSRNGTLLDAGGGELALADATVPGGTALVLGHTELRIDVDAAVAEVSCSERPRFGGLVGDSPAMREVFSQLEKIAASDATVLIEGETGTGKEGVAKALHDEGPRAAAPFVVLDCGAIPAQLLEAELFGHEAGSFTGATDRRIGVFEQASGGTLFLDEVGELPMELQPKLLRALESREIRRVGGRAPIKCDLRIVAATNRDLRAEVNTGAFRADLYYRLAVVKVLLPPLRERASDLALLAAHLLEDIGAPSDVIADLMRPDFQAVLARHPWPGNVRELRNHLEQCAVLRERRAPNAQLAPHPAERVDPSLPYEVARRQALDAFEREYVAALLARTDGNVAAAARSAGVNRTYFHRLISRHNVR